MSDTKPARLVRRAGFVTETLRQTRVREYHDQPNHHEYVLE
jgi:hypothetical protein